MRFIAKEKRSQGSVEFSEILAEMSIGSRATQCLGKQLPDKPHNRASNHANRSLGKYVRWHEEQESGKSIQSSGCAVPSVTSERMYRSRETVKAWLEQTSPISVLDDPDDESPPSSFESFHSSPSGSDHLSCTSRFQTSNYNTTKPAQPRSRTISPPKCSANRNSVDLSRIDAEHYNGGSFLMLAFKNAQYRSSKSPPAFQYTDDHHENFNAQECKALRREFSLTSEWQQMLAAGNAAGMSTRDSSANHSDLETQHEAVKVSNPNSDISNPPPPPQTVSRKSRRTRSMDFKRVVRSLERSASGELKGVLLHDTQTQKKIFRDRGGLQRPLRRSLQAEVFEPVPKLKAYSTARNHREEAKYFRPADRYHEEKGVNSLEVHERAKPSSVMKQSEFKMDVNRSGLMTTQNDLAMGRRKAEGEKATVEVRRADKTARRVMEAQNVRRNTKVSIGCLPLH